MNWLSFRKSLRKLKHERDKENDSLSRLIEDARKKGGAEAANETYQAESVDLNIIDDEIANLITQRLIFKAKRMLLPIPPVTDKEGLWEWSHYINRWSLTTKGIAEIRSLIRQERKEKLELVSHWATMLIGIIGAITGLIAVIMR